LIINYDFDSDVLRQNKAQQLLPLILCPTTMHVVNVVKCGINVVKCDIIGSRI